MFAIVDLQSATIAAKMKSLNGRVSLPNGDMVDNPPVGYVNPPQYEGEENPPARFKIYEAVVVTQGSGSIVNDGEPTYDPVADTVTITRTLSEPVPPSLDEIYDEVMKTQRVFKAYALGVNDSSIVPGMTPAQLKAAVKAKM